MSYLLDTHVLSELRRKAPDRHVVERIAARPPSTLHLSVLMLGEIRKGIDTLTRQETPRGAARLVATCFLTGSIPRHDPSGRSHQPNSDVSQSLTA